jgi:glycosyltransferase involved in cell wall biosynthesis
MATKPLVSVIITSYNYLHFITQAIDSARAQTYPTIEIVVVDNCSTDGTIPALRARYGDDPRVRIFENATNLGESRNSNRGFELSSGEFVLWLSADDWLYPGHIARLHSVFEREPRLDIVHAGAYFADVDGRVYAQRMPDAIFPFDYVDARDELVEMFTTTCPLCYPAALFRRSVFADVGLEDPDGPHASDWEMPIRMALAGKRFAYLADPSVAIRMHAGQQTGIGYHTDGRRVSDFLEIVEKYVDHPGLERLRGRETAVAGFLRALVDETTAAGKPDVLTPDVRERAATIVRRFEERAAAHEPARVRERKISVLLPLARSPQLAARALASVARQTFANWEIVVVDHGALSLRDWLDGHPLRERISYVRSAAPLAPGRARNVALRLARGEYLAFLDEDDTYAPDHLESLVATIERSRAKVAAASARLVLERADTRFLRIEELGDIRIFRGRDDPELGLVADALPLGALLVHCSIRDRAGRFGESTPLLDGFEFLIRVANAERIAFAATVTLDVRVRVDLSSTLGTNLPHYLQVLDAVYAAHPAPQLGALRAAHRTAVERAIGAISGTVSVQTIAELYAALAGHAVRPQVAGR